MQIDGRPMGFFAIPLFGKPGISPDIGNHSDIHFVVHEREILSDLLEGSVFIRKR